MGQLIKDAALVEEATALAPLLGSSTTEAVRRAVHDRLARERRQTAASRQARYERMTATVERAAKLFPPGTTSDHRVLYDENGLPK